MTATTTTEGELLSGRGYGQSTRVSPLQQEWQTSHPLFCAITRGTNVRTYYAKHPGVKSGNSARLHSQHVDPSVLLPPTILSLVNSDAKPRLIDYVQLPLHLWVPEYFYPELVPYMPCPIDNCNARTDRKRWRSGGPRLVHGVQHAAYLHCFEYVCEAAEHRGKVFMGWNEHSLAKLPPLVRSQFRFVMTPEEGVTWELHARIIDARMGGASMTKLQQEMTRNRYTRLYETVTAYYMHVSHHKSQLSVFGRTLTSFTRGYGSEPPYDPLPPVLHHVDAYYDFEAPSVKFMSDIRQRHCAKNATLWTSYTQQLTAERVCMDATFKVVNRIETTSARLLFSMMDIDTRCILTQQLLTHEARQDCLPVLGGYAERCRELGVPVPTRVCNDRGLTDSALIRHPTAFPDAHINIDPWHFRENFSKTLNKQSKMWTTAVKEFAAALYTEYTDDKQRKQKTHAEPEVIIKKVDDIVSHFSDSSLSPVVAITRETRNWWNNQKGDILQHRLCSHPRTDLGARFTMASSQLESYHAQLNRTVRSIAKTNETCMHHIIMQYLFRWNVDRRRQAKLEHDWHTYDLPLVDNAFQACVSVIGTPDTVQMWGRTFTLPRALSTVEHFGLHHPHVSLTNKMVASHVFLPFSKELLDSVHKHYEQSVARTATFGTPLPHSPAKKSPPVPTTAAPATGAGLLSLPPVLPLPPRRQMTKDERFFLASLRAKDKDIRSMIELKEWDAVASRWNSAQLQSNGMSGKTTLNVVHGDMIEKAVMMLDGQAARQLEHAFIQHAAEVAETEFANAVPYVPVSPLVQPWTQYEDSTLQMVVKACSGKKNISWQTVSKRWFRLWQAHLNSHNIQRVLPRGDEQLRSRWSVLKAKKLPLHSATAELKADEQPPIDEKLDEHTDEQKEGEVQDEQNDVHTDNDASADDADLEERRSGSAAVEKDEPLVRTPPSATRRLREMVMAPIFRKWYSTPAVTSASPSSTSSTAGFNSPTTAAATAEAAGESAADTVEQPQQDFQKWGRTRTAVFRELGQDSNFRWTYDEFCEVWAHEEHGYVSVERFKNKCRIERDFNAKGTRVKGKGKKRKDEGEQSTAQPKRRTTSA